MRNSERRWIDLTGLVLSATLAACGAEVGPGAEAEEQDELSSLEDDEASVGIAEQALSAPKKITPAVPAGESLGFLVALDGTVAYAHNQKGRAGVIEMLRSGSSNPKVVYTGLPAFNGCLTRQALYWIERTYGEGDHVKRYDLDTQAITTVVEGRRYSALAASSDNVFVAEERDMDVEDSTGSTFYVPAAGGGERTQIFDGSAWLSMVGEDLYVLGSGILDRRRAPFTSRGQGLSPRGETAMVDVQTTPKGLFLTTGKWDPEGEPAPNTRTAYFFGKSGADPKRLLKGIPFQKLVPTADPAAPFYTVYASEKEGSTLYQKKAKGNGSTRVDKNTYGSFVSDGNRVYYLKTRGRGEFPQATGFDLYSVKF